MILMAKNFKVLFIYPNTQMATLVPINLSQLSACLKERSIEVELFDTTFYKTEEVNFEQKKVELLQLKPFDLGEKGIGFKQTDIYEDLVNDDYLYRKLKYKTRLFISSGGKNIVPDGYKGKHSPFAYKIIEALRSRGGDYGMLTASDMYQFVQKLPSEPVKNGFGDDEPGSEFLLISSSEEKDETVENNK